MVASFNNRRDAAKRHAAFSFSRPIVGRAALIQIIEL
jgi:hypothetical protein